MSAWNEIRRPFRDALIAAFNWDSLARVLQYRCDRRLDRITSPNKGFDQNVDDVIAGAVQTGWLEKLAAGALAENERHAALRATVPPILAGVEAEGKTYYQDFGGLLKEYKSSSRSSYSELARRSDVPRSTIQNWVKGARPGRRRWQDVVRLAASLDLTGQEVDNLLIVLMLPPVRELVKISAYEDDKKLARILGRWAGPPEAEKLRVFLCHATADIEAVRALYRKLRDDGVDPWLDEVNLLPGMEWESEIDTAVRDSDVVLVLLSQGALTTGGYIQKEIAAALDIAGQQPGSAPFLIPARLEPCDVPERLARYQWVNLYEADGYERLLRALQLRAEEAGRPVTGV
jgi:transcriptional regulator with XRE-family HTH domain